MAWATSGAAGIEGNGRIWACVEVEGKALVDDYNIVGYQSQGLDKGVWRHP